MKNPKELHEEFVRLGRERYRLMNRLLMILPEIYQSGIWKKYADDIYEYAGRFGGISGSAVEKRLKLEKNLADKPMLREAIEKVGINKVALVATLATPQNEAVFADKALNMSKSALVALSKELREKGVASVESDDGAPQISLCHAKPQTITIELDEEMTFLFLKLKNKFKKLNNREVMRRILETADERTHKVSFAKKPNSITGDEIRSESGPEPRTIKTKRKRQTLGNGKCAYPGCNKPAENIHHQERYGKTKNHNKLVALCKDHHEFMHNGLIENEQSESQNWTMNIHKTPDIIDQLYRKHRADALG